MTKKNAPRIVTEIEIRNLALWCIEKGYGFLMKEPFFVRVKGQ